MRRFLLRPPRFNTRPPPPHHHHKYYTTETTTPSFSPQDYLSSAKEKFRSTLPRQIPAILTPDRSILLTQALNPTSTSHHVPSTLPQGHHMVYFEPVLSLQEQMPDGTNIDHWPGGPFVRRMWAGGIVKFYRPQPELNKKTEMVCMERVDGENVSIHLNEGNEEKDKVFVDLERDYFVVSNKKDGEKRVKVIEEKRKLVFMRDRVAQQQPVKDFKAPWKPEIQYPLHPTRELLKMFSQLTNNAHLIHLDHEYAQKHEGYKDVLVHGPLMLVLMLEALSKEGGFVKEIEYRNLSPLAVNEDLTVCLRRKGEESKGKEQIWTVWIEGPGGRLIVKGKGVACG